MFRTRRCANSFASVSHWPHLSISDYAYSVFQVEHSSAPSDMFSICAAALQEETSKTKLAQEKCESLEEGNISQLNNFP